MNHPESDGTVTPSEASAMKAKQGAPIRLVTWTFHLALPLLGLWLLIRRPELDLTWEHHPAHFWLVMAVAATGLGLGVRVSEAARRHADARLFLVSLAFLASAGFLFLHALATPGVLLAGRNAGFTVATPVGLSIAAVFAVASSINFTPRGSAAVMRRQAVARGALALVLLAWAAISLLELPPLRTPPAEADRPLTALAIGAVLLYSVAAVRYYRLYRRRPAVMLLGIVTAFTLLAEAMVAVTVTDSWRLSWWEWHLLMAAGFGFVAYSAYVHYQREGSAIGLFDGIAVEQTVWRIREEYGDALEALTSAMRRQEETGWTPAEMELITAGLTSRFGLTEGQTRVLGRAAEALSHERDQILRLGALVAIGQEASVIVTEAELLRRAVRRIAEGLGRDALRVGLVSDGRLVFPAELATATWPERAIDDDAEWAAVQALSSLQPVQAASGLLILPLTVKDNPAGVLEVRRPNGDFVERDRLLLRSLASQLSIALENTRLYRQIDVLFRQYMSPDVATALLADPGQAALGGAMVDVTALFADLRGFTAFSERSSPQEIVVMLNRYFGVATPSVLGHGGTVVQFVGDALLALFNAPARQPDHPLRAARAALAMQRSIEEIAEGNPGWPRFRVGVNTGSALVGNIGSTEMRSFNAMGDAINVAARLQSIAEPGQVVIGAATLSGIEQVAEVQPLGDLEVRGRQARVSAYVLTALHEPATNKPVCTGEDSEGMDGPE